MTVTEDEARLAAAILKCWCRQTICINCCFNTASASSGEVHCEIGRKAVGPPMNWKIESLKVQ